MAIVGDRPEQGVRLRLDKKDEPAAVGASADSLVYEGQISTPDADFAVRIEADPSGNVVVATEAGPELAEKARLMVRTVLRHATSEGLAPPRRIQRWRGDK